jgi:tetratricopeptide (TPR) repeat protein
MPVASVSIGLVAAIATATAAVATLFFRELARRRTDLDEKVASAVSASIGNTLISLREFESRAKASLDETMASAAGIEQHLKERLDLSEQQTDRLSELLEKASSVVPTLETSRSAIPALLLAEARRASLDDALRFLSALLANDQATPLDLVAGGDLAKDALGADALALELFEKATTLNTALVGSRAVAIQMRARAGTQSLQDAREELFELAVSNLSDRRVLVAITNHYNEYEDWNALLEVLDRLLELAPAHPLLWRNRGLAFDRLRRNDEAAEAYARAYEIAEENGDVTEASNTVRPYAPFLIARERYEEAREVLERVLAREPDSGWVLRQLGELWEVLGDAARSRVCYETAVTVSTNPSEQVLVQTQLNRLMARHALIDKGVLDGVAAAAPRKPGDTLTQNTRPTSAEAPH